MAAYHSRSPAPPANTARLFDDSFRSVGLIRDEMDAIMFSTRGSVSVRSVRLRSARKNSEKPKGRQLFLVVTRKVDDEHHLDKITRSRWR